LQNNYTWCKRGKPVLIVEIPKDEISPAPKFLWSSLEEVLTKGTVPEQPVFLISIAGAQNSGKTFLLQLMNVYTQYYSQVGVKKLVT